MNIKETKKSSESLPPPPTSFSSLPYDIALNILARISRSHRPILSLVSKSFRSLIASPELEVTRTLIGITEDCLYICLDQNQKKTNPRWFALAPIPNQQKLLPVPDSFPYQHPDDSSAVVSIGSEIYIIGGTIEGKRCRTVLVLDSPSHQWRRLPEMRVPRARSAVDVIDGKIYVIGGCEELNNIEHWGEVYDLKKRTWEPLSPTTLDLTSQKSVVPDRLVMGGKVYDLKFCFRKNVCLVEMDKNVLCQIAISAGTGLMWQDANEELCDWRSVTGLEGLCPSSYIPKNNALLAKSCRGRRVTVWWETEKVFGSDCRHCICPKERKKEIWCAEISFERRRVKELWGVVEWSKSVFTFDGSNCGWVYFLHSAIVTQ